MTMRNLFRVDQGSNGIHAALLLARLGIAALMLTHGIPKMVMLFSAAPLQFPGMFGMSPELSLGLAVFAEVICSILLIVGMGTRLAVLPLITTMLIALIFVHAADPFAKQEPAIYYLLVYLTLLLSGAGKYSLDYLLQAKLVSTNKEGVNMQDATFSIQ